MRQSFVEADVTTLSPVPHQAVVIAVGLVDDERRHVKTAIELGSETSEVAKAQTSRKSKSMCKPAHA